MDHHEKKLENVEVNLRREQSLIAGKVCSLSAFIVMDV